MKTWFTIDGQLDPIAHSGESFFRFPEELAERVIRTYSTEGGRVLDPFCGFGTTLVVAERLGRIAVGIEKDQARAAFAAGRVGPPTTVIHRDAGDVESLELEPFDLIFTSPPYTTFRDWDDGPSSPDYFGDLRHIFRSLRGLLKDTGVMIVEISNIRDGSAYTPLAWDVARELAKLYSFRGEIVRCNTGPERAGPGVDHSYLLEFHA